MGRKPCCSKEGLNRGTWTAQEDKILRDHVILHGQGKWRNLPLIAGLNRCGKSCRLRWLNYLKPDIKIGNISTDEEELIIRLHRLLGNRWSLIAGRLPGRTDNEIKNYWNTNLRKKVQDDVGGDSKTDPSAQENKNHHHHKVKAQSSFSSHPNNIVIHTKASKCSKVVLLNPSLPHSSMQMQSNKIVTQFLNEKAEPLLMDNNVVAAANGDKMEYEPVLSFPYENENDFSTEDLLLDFDIGEIYLPEFLNSNFLNNHEDLMPFSEHPLFRTHKNLCDKTNVANSSCFCEDKNNGS